MSGSDDLKVAIVGMRHGHVGQPGAGTGYLETLKHVRGAEVVAYCEDSDADLLEQAGRHQPGAALYDDVDDLITNEEFDVGWVVLPAAEVPGAGIKLAEAGKHFYMEKQFARTSADVRRKNLSAPKRKAPGPSPRQSRWMRPSRALVRVSLAVLLDFQPVTSPRDGN